MKPLRILAYLMILLATAGSFACTDDNNNDPVPSDPRSSFTGTWLVNEQWTKLTYEVNITLDEKSTDGVYISNFGGGGATAFAFISGNSISLTTDEYLSNGWIVNGSGTLSGTKMNWNYTRNDGANLIYATALFTRN